LAFYYGNGKWTDTIHETKKTEPAELKNIFYLENFKWSIQY
jgi:hypothetical protein